MADKQKILELDIDVEGVIRKSADLKNELDNLRKTQADMKKSGDTSSEAYVKLEAQIKKVSGEYANNQKQLINLTTAGGGLIAIQDKMNFLLNEEVTSINRAKIANEQLKVLRNELNLATKEGQKALEEINKKIDQNDAFIKKNVSSLEQQKIGIGDYKTAITEALNETGFFNGQLAELKQIGMAVSGVFGLLKKDFSESADMIRNSARDTQNMTLAQKAMTIATNVGAGAFRILALAMAATGISIIIAAVVLLISYFKTFTPVVDFVEQAMAGLGAVVKVVQKGVVAFVTGLSDLGNTLKKIGSFLANPIKGFKDMAGAMEEAYDAAAKLKKEQQDLEDAMELQEIASAKNRAEINRLTIQAKDRTKTEEERLALLQKASKIEDEDFKQRKKNSDEALRIAQQQIINEAELTEAEAAELRKRGFEYKEFVEQRTNGTDELFDALKEAILAQTDIENEFYTNQEKNINKQNKLIEDAEASRLKAIKDAEDARKKAEESRQKALDDAVNKSKAELDLFISQQGIRAKSLEEGLRFEESVRDKRLQIAQQEFNASKKTETDKLKLLTDQNNIKNEFLQKQSEVAISFAQRELDAYIKNNATKVEQDKFFTELALQEEQRRLDLIAEKRKQFEALRYEQGIIDEYAYQEAIKAIQDETRIKKEEEQTARDEAEKERKAVDLENQRAIEDLLFQESLDIQLQRLEQQRQLELKQTEKTEADKALINKKFDLLKLDLVKKTEASKVQMVLESLTQVSGLLKENTFAAKTLSIAAATISTYAAIAGQLQAFSKIPIPGYAIAQAIATGAVGFANVAKIAGVKLAKGGRVVGPGTGTSDSIPAHLSNGETVINARSSEMFAPLLSALNVAGGGVAFAQGSLSYPIISGTNSGNSNSSNGIDYDLLASKISEANANLPAPVVFTAVEDINTGQKNYANVVNGANL